MSTEAIRVSRYNRAILPLFSYSFFTDETRFITIAGPTLVCLRSQLTDAASRFHLILPKGRTGFCYKKSDVGETMVFKTWFWVLAETSRW